MKSSNSFSIEVNSEEYYSKLLDTKSGHFEHGCGRRTLLLKDFVIKESIIDYIDSIVSGINQNRAERLIFKRYEKDYEFLAKILYSSDRIVVMERLESDPDVIEEFVEENYNGGLNDKFKGYILETFGNRLKELSEKTGLYLRDLYSISNWAIDYKTLELKLIDFGALECTNYLLDLIEVSEETALLKEYDCD